MVPTKLILKNLAVLITALLFLISCDPVNSSRNTQINDPAEITTPEDENPEITTSINGLETVLQFNLPVASATTRNLAANPDFLLAIDPINKVQIGPQPIQQGINQVSLPKDQWFLIGLYEGQITSDQTTDSTSFRSLSNALSLLGTIKVVAVDLEVLPIGETATDQIDLGTITATGTAFESAISPGVYSSSAGVPIDYLESFGITDDLLAESLNVDIDKNGQLDSEQDFVFTGADMDYGIYPTYTIAQLTGEIDPLQSIKWLQESPFSINLGFGFSRSPVDRPEWDEIYLVQTHPDGSSRTYYPESAQIHSWDEEFYAYNTVVANNESSYSDELLNSADFFDGEYGVYRIDNDEPVWVFDRFNFANLRAGSSGIPVVFLKLDQDAESNLTGIKWEWYFFKNGIPEEITNADYLETLLYKLLIELFIDGSRLSFLCSPGHTDWWIAHFDSMMGDNAVNEATVEGDPVSINGSVDVPSWGLKTSVFQGGRVQFQDIAGNTYTQWFSIEPE